MLRYLLRSVRRVLTLLGNALPPEPPQDLYARVRTPRGRGPRRRDGAVALREPEEHAFVRAIGRLSKR